MTLRTLLLLAIALPGLLATTASAQFSAFLEGAKQPQLAAAGDQVHIAYVQDGEVRCLTLDKGGAKLASATVAAPPKLMSGMRRGPRVAASGDTVVVTAVADEPARLMAWRSTDAGKTWAEAADSLAAEPGVAREGLHDMAAGPDGKMAVVWLDLRNVEQSGTELWIVESADAGATWDAPRRLYHNPGGTICECCHPSITYDTDGEPVALFRNVVDGDRDMYLWRSGDSGKAEKLGVGSWPLNGCPMAGGDVVAFVNPMNDRETVATVWRREGTIYAASPGDEEGVVAEGRDPVLIVSESGWPAILYTRPDGLFLNAPMHGTYRVDADRAAYPAANALGDSIVAAYETKSGVEVRQIKSLDSPEKTQ